MRIEQAGRTSAVARLIDSPALEVVGGAEASAPGAGAGADGEDGGDDVESGLGVVDVAVVGVVRPPRRASNGALGFSARVNMYAIVKTGGKQYRVQEGQWLLVERLPEPEGERSRCVRCCT